MPGARRALVIAAALAVLLQATHAYVIGPGSMLRSAPRMLSPSGYRVRGTSTCPTKSPALLQSQALVGLGPVVLAPRLRRPLPLCMTAGTSGDSGDKLTEAEAALDDAIASSDVNAINKWMKVIEKLQAQGGGPAGAEPYTKKKMSKEDEAAAIQELLG